MLPQWGVKVIQSEAAARNATKIIRGAHEGGADGGGRGSSEEYRAKMREHERDEKYRRMDDYERKQI